MSAKDYPVTQDYGYDPSYPTADHFHKGIDYGCPMDTPIVVNGVQIGLSGNTGFVTGPHLHVGRWIGGTHTNPGVGNGFNFGDAVVTEVNQDATNGKYVRVQGDGASWVYLHMSQQTATVGQRLTAAVPAAPAPPNNSSSVTLPAHVATWAVYRVGSGLRKGTDDQLGNLAPAQYGGLTYAIKSWVGDYAVIIDTQTYGEVTIWVKNTDAQFGDAPTPPPPAPSLPYTIENIASKQVKINKQTHKWGLNYDNFTAIANNPEGNIDQNHDPLTVTAILHHNIGYNYYLEDANVASGYNVLDCDDYTPPPPPPVKTAPPAGALIAPNFEQYEIVKAIRGYQTSNQAVNHTNDKVDIPAGTYYIFNKRFANGTTDILALNVTKTPGTPGAWINILDNVPDPDPDEVARAEAAQKAADEAAAQAAAEAKAAEKLAHATPIAGTSYKPFPKIQRYVLMTDLHAFNLADDSVIASFHKYDEVFILGAIKKNGVTYARLQTTDENQYEGVPVFNPGTKLPNLELYDKVYSDKTSLDYRKANKTLNTEDYVRLGYGYAKQFVLGFRQLLSKIRVAKATK